MNYEGRAYLLLIVAVLVRLFQVELNWNDLFELSNCILKQLNVFVGVLACCLARDRCNLGQTF